MDWYTRVFNMVAAWDSDTVAAWVAAIAAVVAVVPSLINGVNWFQQQQTQRLLEKRVGAKLYPSIVLKQATRYYVEPDSSILDPAREEEIRNVRAPKEKVYAALDDFFEKQSVYRHMIILADSGMGKTSLLINYFVRNYNRRKPYNIKLLPLGIPNLDQLIEEVPNKEDTTIFLDAFDEDTKAIADHKDRLRELMEACRCFDRVVITCRTQFFPDDEEIPKETGILRVGPRAGGEGRAYTFQKLYLMPLTDQQVAQYLRKRYPLWQRSKRKRAQSIVEKIPLLSVRPMLLTHIPDLLGQNVTIQYSYELYEAMVEAWLQREKDWIDPVHLRQFSERLAVDLYIKRKLRGSERLPREELAPLLLEWRMPLDVQYISGRSLLNRDADGSLKFAHRSIMEYLFLCCDVSRLEQDWRGIILTDQMISFVQEAATNQMLPIFRNLPNCNLNNISWYEEKGTVRRQLGQVNLTDADLAGANLSRASLMIANLEGANLIGTNLMGASLVRANLERANLSGANLMGAFLTGANLRVADLEGADLTGARYDLNTMWPSGFNYQKSGALGPCINLEGANLEGDDLEGANLEGANLKKTNLRRANLEGANLEGADLEGANLERADLEKASLKGANLSEADLKGANLEGTNLTGARYDLNTMWPSGFNYQNSGALGPRANLVRANLVGANLVGANLVGANLEGANLEGANLERANLKDANLSDANLSDASLEGANLTGARYDLSTMWPSGFDYQNSGALLIFSFR